MAEYYKCIFCKDSYKRGKPIVIDESLPRWVKRTLECETCGKELELARKEVKLFGDPVKISFKPEDLSGEEEDGIKMADIWKDPIARTLWLALASHYLKDQYFRSRRLAEADLFRKQPPRTVDEFISNITISDWMFSRVDNDIARALYPYIIYELNQEGRWKYFITMQLPRQSLQWRYEEPKPYGWSSTHVNGVPASRRPEGSRVILLED